VVAFLCHSRRLHIQLSVVVLQIILYIILAQRLGNDMATECYSSLSINISDDSVTSVSAFKHRRLINNLFHVIVIVHKLTKNIVSWISIQYK
jgi:hypothetical protein